MSVAYGEQQRQGSAPGASGNQPQRELERQYHVVLQDSLGHPALGFRDGTWFRLAVSGPQALQLRGAIRTCPHAAGSIVQIACWWMRENPLQPRSLDLATELALTVGELVRVCPADGLGSTSMDLLPMAMAAVAQSGPPAAPAPALPAGTSTSSYPTNGFGSQDPLGSSGYGSTNGFGSQDPLGSSGYSSTSGYGSTGAATSGYASSSGSSTGYAGGAAPTGYGSASGYGSANGSSSGYTSTNGSTGSYTSTNGSTGSYGSTNGSTGTYGSGSYATAETSQSSYSASSAYSTSTSYDSAQTSYLPAAQAAPATSLANGWFEPADGTGTGGFPKVPPAPVMGRPSAPAAGAAPAAKPYPPAARGYNGAAQPQAALPAAPSAPPANRGYGEAADWEPRSAAPRRPSHQPRPQQAAPRPAPVGNGQVPRPAPTANGQTPRPRPQQAPPDDRRDQQDLSRSSDRNTVPPRRPATGQQRGTMGRRPATRPGRPSDW